MCLGYISIDTDPSIRVTLPTNSFSHPPTHSNQALRTPILMYLNTTKKQ